MKVKISKYFLQFLYYFVYYKIKTNADKNQNNINIIML